LTHETFGNSEAGQGLLDVCIALGKFPHEFEECGEAEEVFILSAWNAKNAEKKD
jgi:hypothetical protein